MFWMDFLEKGEWFLILRICEDIMEEIGWLSFKDLDIGMGRLRLVEEYE